ncbi:substrate-binding periplasmic protein [Rhodoferax aquaticus]|nr:transporter substrate-binding domain-containing protein [Rhodoferax aquaticus]
MRNSTLRVGYALLVFFLLSLQVAVAQVRPFHFAGDEDEAPFGFRNEKKEFVGIYVDILQEAFNRMNVKYLIKGYPWARAQMLVEHGGADAMITVATPTRELIAVANTEALATHQWVAFAKSDSAKFQQIMSAKTLDELKGLKVLDYLGDGWGEKNLAGFDVDRGGNFSQVLLKLAAQRGDVFVQMQLPTQYVLNELKAANPGNDGLAKVVAATNVLDSKKFYLLVSKKSPYVAMLPQVDKTIAGMRADGTIQKIHDKYVK